MRERDERERERGREKRFNSKHIQFNILIHSFLMLAEEILAAMYNRQRSGSQSSELSLDEGMKMAKPKAKKANKKEEEVAAETKVDDDVMGKNESQITHTEVQLMNA